MALILKLPTRKFLTLTSFRKSTVAARISDIIFCLHFCYPLSPPISTVIIMYACIFFWNFFIIQSNQKVVQPMTVLLLMISINIAIYIHKI